MSAAFAPSDFAALMRSSSSLRSCRIACAFAWSCQKFGSLVFSSTAAICFSALATSKIAPHEFDALAQIRVALL